MVKRLTKSVLTKKLDIEWSRIIRTRGEKCAVCGKDGTLHAAHIFSRKSRSTRWDLDNGVCLCYYHHLHWAHKEPILFNDFIREYLGDERLEALKQRAKSVRKWTVDEMESYLKFLRSK